MENQMKESRQRMTSLEIAEVTGKPHNDVMKAIRKMEPAWVRICQGKFSLTSRMVQQPNGLTSRMVQQPNGGTRKVPCYSLTKTECLYVATKFNDEARAKLVLRLLQKGIIFCQSGCYMLYAKYADKHTVSLCLCVHIKG